MEPKELYEKAKELVKEGNFTAAITHLNELLLQRPGNKKAMALRGKAYLNAAEFQKAIADLNKVKDEIDSADRNLWLAYRGIGIECLTAGNNQQAVNYFESTKPNTSHGYAEDISFLRGLAYLEFAAEEFDSIECRSRLVSAEANFDDMLGDDPTFAPAFVGRGRCHLLNAVLDARDGYEGVASHLKKAVNEFTEAIKVDPEMGDAYFYRGEAYTLWLAHGGTGDMRTLAHQDHQRAKALSPRWAEVVDHRQRLRDEAERLARLNEAARRQEQQRIDDEYRRRETERNQRIEHARSNAGVLSGIWNWLIGKSKCPQCGTRDGREESRELLDRWQEVMTDYSQAQGSYRPQAVYNVRAVRGHIHCEGCGHRWTQAYTESFRA